MLCSENLPSAPNLQRDIKRNLLILPNSVIKPLFTVNANLSPFNQPLWLVLFFVSAQNSLFLLLCDNPSEWKLFSMCLLYFGLSVVISVLKQHISYHLGRFPLKLVRIWLQHHFVPSEYCHWALSPILILVQLLFLFLCFLCFVLFRNGSVLLIHPCYTSACSVSASQDVDSSSAFNAVALLFSIHLSHKLDKHAWHIFPSALMKSDLNSSENNETGTWVSE